MIVVAALGGCYNNFNCGNRLSGRNIDNRLSGRINDKMMEVRDNIYDY